MSQRAKSARRGGSGSQAVGDYVGQPAGEAAQAVRRAGLRPGLDRSFGCPAELVGLVVAQDPTAGSDLARNGMVTLYVAAPGGEPLDDDAQAASNEPNGELAIPEPIEEALSPPRVPLRPRRRKPGHARQAAVEPPPPPILPTEAASEHAPAAAATQPLEEWPDEIDAPASALEEEPTSELGEREFPHEDFVVHVEDVLAGRSGPSNWRGAYPRRRRIRRGGDRGRVRAWVGEHRMLAGIVGAALALWVIVGLASALDGHRTRTHPASAVAPSVTAKSHAAPTRKPPAAQKSITSRTPARSLRRYRARHAASSPRIPRPTPRPVHRAAPAARQTVAAAATPAPAPQTSAAPVPRASTPPAPAVEQSGGGLFSP
ncbi:MAG TPA: PASTA domain-containing protein [Solirubrobacteraceae bacterium]|nr:PASTA domain-containing protein [Solirubrobacteraceae bacterium]